MQQISRDNKDITFVKEFLKNIVLGINKSSNYSTCADIEDLRSPRMRIGVTRPAISKSVLAADMPRVLRPGNSSAAIMVAEERYKLSVSSFWFNSEVMKSAAVTDVGFLQVNPLMKTFFSSVPAGHVSSRLSP